MTEASRPVRFTVLVALAVCASLPVPLAFQAPAPQGDRIVVGQLVDGVTGRPVGNALITISSGQSAIPGPGRAGAPASSVRTERVFADDAGRFMFHSLPAGSYALAATLSGYQSAEFGQTRMSGVGTRLELQVSTPRVTNVTMKIWKLGSIAGTIRDESGEPIGGARLQLVMVTGSASRRLYTVRGFGAADDRGAYRFGELQPGDYAVQVPLLVNSIPIETAVAYLDAMADRSGNRVRDDITASGGTLTTVGYQVGDQLIQPTTTGARGLPTTLMIDAKGRLLVYPQTYYPGVHTIAAATIVTLLPGTQRSGLDISVRPVPAFRVAGVVNGPSGPAPNTTVKFVPAGVDANVGTPSIGGEIAMAVTRSDGTFTAMGIPAGSYTVSVVKTAAPPSVDGPAPTDLRLWWAQTPLTVSDADVSKLRLDLVSGVTIGGRVEFDSSAAAPPAAALQRLRVSVIPAEGMSGARPMAPPVNSDGTFLSNQLRPGNYVVAVAAAPAGYIHKELRVGGRDTFFEPVVVSESGLQDVVVVLTDKVGELAGAVVKGVGAAEIRVYAVPVDASSSARVRSARLQRVLAGHDGTYRFPALVSGEYVVAAVSADAPEPDLEDPRVTAALVRLGTRVTVGDKEKKAVNLPVVVLR